MRASCILVSLLPSLGAVPAAAETLVVPAWKVVGPFETGSREGFVHHLAGLDGRVPRSFTFQETWPSVLADGGRVGWSDALPEAGADGRPGPRTSLDLQGVDWDARQSEWGAAGLANVAYAQGSLENPRAGRFLVRGSRCVAWIGGELHAGDPYGAGVAVSVIALPPGRHDVLVASSGYGGSRAFTLELERLDAEAPAVRVVEADLTLPDLVAGKAGGGVVGVALLNTTDVWLAPVTVRLSGALVGQASLELPLAPRAPLKVPIEARWEAPQDGTTEASFRVDVEVATEGHGAGVDASVRVRTPGQSRVVAFRSRQDGSAQVHGLLPATAPPPPAGHGLIMTAHGAGVGPGGQVDAYSAKDWACVVAPTNRRPYGFDWHLWGEQDFLEVMDLALETLPIDRDRVIVTGHSMGGHGAWVLGTHHPDRFAACSPSAGWISYDAYVPPTLRRSVNLGDSSIAAAWLRGIAPGRVGALLGNLRNVEISIVHGGADDNVPPTHARLLAGALEGLGLPAWHVEVPGQGHWWDLDKERPGADCVDAAWLEDWWRGARRQARPARVTFTVPDLDVSRRAWWVEVLAVQRVPEEAHVDAELVAPGHVRVATRNVAALALELEPPPPDRRGTLVEINGRASLVRVPSPGRRLVLADRGSGLEPARSWRPALEGPRPRTMAKALSRPFLLVAGTEGSAERDGAMLHLARTLAAAWWVRANGLAPVVRDTDVTDDLRERFDLVLLGGPGVNAEADLLERSLAITATAAGVRIAGRGLPGGDLAAAHWQPDPRRPHRRILVLQATSAVADELLVSLNPIGAGIGLPDFVVVGPEVRLRSWAGFRAAGWWAPDFGFDDRSAWLAHDR